MNAAPPAPEPADDETGVTYDASMEANAVVEHWDAAVDHVRDVVMPRRPVWTTSA